MELELRSERPGDEDAIDAVNCRAFGSMNEPNIVRLMREHHPDFDPRYSITARDGGEMVGHILLTPASLRLMGSTIRAVAVGPVAVVPERQGQGIGGQLLRHGHALGRDDGFAMAFLFGHPGYYPRHGYEACLGLAKVTIDADDLPEPSVRLRTMPVRKGDVAWIAAQHAAELADVDFGWVWGPRLNEWRLACLNSMMWWTDDGRRAAYTLHDRLVLGEDAALAREVISAMRPEKLEHHPSGRLARQLEDCRWADFAVEACEAGMACELQDGALEPYMEAVSTGDRPVGATLFPLPFLAC